MDSKRTIKVVVRGALFNVRKCIEDGVDSRRFIGIKYSKKTWKKIMTDFDEFEKYAKTQNLEVTVPTDGSRHINYRLFKKEIWQ